jgi:hypothetical protein
VRKALALAGLAGLFALTACGKDAASSGSPSPGGGSPTNSPAKPADPLTLGPDGFGPVKLGASTAEVKAAGVKVQENWSSNKDCPDVADLPVATGSGTVQISKKDGAAIIEAGGTMHTPEGITFKSPLDAVKKAYPTMTTVSHDSQGGEYLVTVPGSSPEAVYRILTTPDDKVGRFQLKFKETDCDN